MNKKFIIVIFVIVALLILFVFSVQFRNKTQINVTPSPVKSNLEVKTFSIVLNSQNNSNQSGIVIFEPKGDKTLVKLNLVGYNPGVVQPAHIHGGTCEKPIQVKHNLNNVLDGKSETTIDVKIEELLKDLPLVINVHKSIEEDNVYVACGEILPQ